MGYRVRLNDRDEDDDTQEDQDTVDACKEHDEYLKAFPSGALCEYCLNP